VNDHLTLYHRRLVETYGLIIEAIYDCKESCPAGYDWFVTGANGESAYERRERLYELAMCIESWVDLNIGREDQFSDIRAPGLGAWDGDVIPAIWERFWSEPKTRTNYTEWGPSALRYLSSQIERGNNA
tara:strand:+ start:350 stop:736 length:387 start_codon:yes stop_codon:yes gene_type:complete